MRYLPDKPAERYRVVRWAPDPIDRRLFEYIPTLEMADMSVTFMEREPDTARPALTYESGAPLTERARREALNRRVQKLFASEHREEPVDSEYERHTRDEALAEHMAELEADDQARAEAMAERFAEDQARAEAEAEARAENGEY